MINKNARRIGANAIATFSLFEEAKLLGDYGTFTLEKESDGYAIKYPSGQHLYCYWTDANSFANKFIDEAYPVKISPNGEYPSWKNQKVNG